MTAGSIEPTDLPGSARLILAFSGGPDSVCLLHLLTRAELSRDLLCIHIDHGMDEHSGQRGRRAAAIAEAMGIHCRIISVDVPTGEGPEAAARKARYAALEQAMEHGDTLLTAHHADDQTETVLLRLIRGAGPAGLGGIRSVRAFGPGWLSRPLLDWSRSRIEAWLKRHELEWIEDPTNDRLDFDRNFIRHEIIPRLRQRWPGVDRSIARSARLCRGADALVVRAVDAGLDAARCPDGSLAVDALEDDTPHYLATLIRSWCILRGIDPPPGRRLDSFLNQVESADKDRIPELRWGDHAMRFWRRRLWLEPDPCVNLPWQLAWDGRHALDLPNDTGCLILSGAEGSSLPITVSSGREGDVLRPAGDHCSRACKRLLADAGVPPWQREHWPRIWMSGRLVALGGRWLEAGFRDQLESRQQTLTWQPGPRQLAATELEFWP